VIHLARLLLLILLLTSCKSTTVQTEDLSSTDNDLFCKGTRNMITYLKQSQEIKSRYHDNLHNKEQVGFKIDAEVWKALPSHTSNLSVAPDTLAIKKLRYQCFNQSDSSPDFEVTFYFYPKKKILTTSVMTMLNKPGYRTGYEFSTQLTEDGELGKVETSTIQE